MTRAVFAAGGPAPEVLDEVTLEGRFGIVLPRLDGPTLLQLSRSGAMTREQTGAVLATLAISVHKTAAPPDVLSLRDRMDGALRHSHRIPQHIATGILTLIERLPLGSGLCHGDLHPGNVIMTADGPRLIDWIGATRAPAALDLACCHVLLCELAPERVDDPERPRAVNAALQFEYAQLAGMSPRGADGGDGALPARQPGLHPPRAGREPCPAGAADPARRSGPAFGELIGQPQAHRACPMDSSGQGTSAQGRVESGSRTPAVIYCASVSPNVRCVSTIVRPTPAAISDNCAGHGLPLRVRRYIIVRRYNYAPHRYAARLPLPERLRPADMLTETSNARGNGFCTDLRRTRSDTERQVVVSQNLLLRPRTAPAPARPAARPSPRRCGR